MTDTPLTDDIARGNHVVPTEFAQDLERQLMEQCKRLAISADREESLQDQRDFAIGDIERLRKERDEARAKTNRQAERIQELEGATNHAGGTPLTIALRERDEARVVARWLYARLKAMCLDHEHDGTLAKLEEAVTDDQWLEDAK